MLCRKSGGGEGAEPVFRQQIPELYQSVVIIPVPVHHNRNRRRSVPPEPVPHIGHDQVRQTAGVHRHAENHQIFRAEFISALPPGSRRREIQRFPAAYAQCLPHAVGQK